MKARAEVAREKGAERYLRWGEFGLIDWEIEEFILVDDYGYW